MSIDLNGFWQSWDVVSGNTQANNQYDFWKGMVMTNGDVLANQYEFFTYHNTTRYEWFKALQGTYPEVWDEYTFYKNTNDARIYDYYTFYKYCGEYLVSPSGDADAAAYLAAVVSAGGTVDGTITSAVETLFTSLKSNSLYNDILIMYPMIGGTLASHAINAKSPATYDLTWYGTPTANLDGTYINGGYGDPVLYADDANITPNDTSVGVYVSVACTGCGTEVEFGGTTATSSYEGGYIFPLGTSPVYKVIYSNGLGGPSWSDNLARYGLLNKVSSTSQNIWENGSKVSTQSITSRAAEHQKQMLGCWFIDGDAPYYNSTKTIGFFHLGKSLDDTEATNFMSIVNTFNTTLSRNIY